MVTLENSFGCLSNFNIWFTTVSWDRAILKMEIQTRGRQSSRRTTPQYPQPNTRCSSQGWSQGGQSTGLFLPRILHGDSFCHCFPHSHSQPKADSWQPLGGASACRREVRPLCAGSGVGRGTESPGMLLLDGSSQIGQFLALADR